MFLAGIYFMIFSSLLINEINGANSCAIRRRRNDDDKLGPYDSVTVDIYDCTNTIIPRNEKCVKIKQNVYLPKDKLVNINYDIYGYAVEAKFYGLALCVKYRKFIINGAWGEPNTYSCSSRCAEMFDTESNMDEDKTVWAGYERTTKCETDGCGSRSCIGSSSKYLKFVNVTNPDTDHPNFIKSNPFLFTIILMLSVVMFQLMV